MLALMSRADMTSTAQPQLAYRDFGSGDADWEASEAEGVQRVSMSLERKAGVRTLESSKWWVCERSGVERGRGR